MYTRSLLSFAASCGILAPAAYAQRPLPLPASVLIHPEYDSTPGHVTLITVTNTNVDPVSGTINVEFVYRESEDCLEFNRTERLTPGDTLTALSTFHNPTMTRGYVYMVARDPITQATVSFNHLISTATMLDGISGLDYDVEPFTYRAIGAQGTPTDLDGDDQQDLNGVEYEQSPDVILIPRFHGQPNPSGPIPPGSAQSDLVLLNLTGAVQFSAIVDFLVWNDNTQVFSAQYVFSCWDRVALDDISGLFTNDFLQTATGHDPAEPIGAPAIDNGWIRIDGNIAYSPFCSKQDPAILGFLIERVSGSDATASLPFMQGRQANGTLTDTGMTIDGCLVSPDGGMTRRERKQLP